MDNIELEDLSPFFKARGLGRILLIILLFLFIIGKI